MRLTEGFTDFRKYLRLAGYLLPIGLLTACGSNPPAPVTEHGRLSQIEKHGGTAATATVTPAPLPSGHYLVKKGDTLYSVSLDHGQSYRDVATWNNLEDPNKIQVGQQLRVVPPMGSETKPVAGPAAVEARPLDKVSDTDPLKREPKGGKQPYTPEALAKLQKTDTAPPSPVSTAATPPVSDTTVKPADKPIVADKGAGEKSAVKPAAKPMVATTTGSDATLEWDWPARGKLIAGFVEGSNKGLDLAGKTGEPVLAAAAGKVTLVSNALRGYGNLVVIKHNDVFLSVYAHNSRILVKEEQIVAKGQKIAEIGSSDSDQPKLHFEIRRQGKPIDPAKFLPAR